MKKLSYKAKWIIATIGVMGFTTLLLTILVLYLTQPITTSQSGMVYVKTYRIDGIHSPWLDFSGTTKVDTILTFRERFKGYIIDDKKRLLKSQAEISTEMRLNRLTIDPMKKFNENVRLDNYLVDIEIHNPELLVNLFKKYHNIVLYELLKIETHIVIEDAVTNKIDLNIACDEHLGQYGICITNIRNKKDLTFEEIYIN